MFYKIRHTIAKLLDKRHTPEKLSTIEILALMEMGMMDVKALTKKMEEMRTEEEENDTINS